ncbi:MAG: AI-2E family transporter [Proteobacteria bacterium]|jgi:predicted PurR-regulated permease PerM|nr:AI-2E family transporter [Pseudomonadota bacterium]
MTDDPPPRDAPAKRGDRPARGESAVAGEPRRAPESSASSGQPVHRPLAARQYLWIVGAALVLLAALHWLGPILTPFLIGAILAYLGSPAVARAEAHGVPRSLTTLAVIVFIGVLVAALFLVLVPLVQAEVATAAARLPDLFAQFTDHVAPWLQEKLGVTLSLDFASIKDFVTENAQAAKNVSLTLLSGVKTGSAILLSVVLNLALIPVVMFYLLRDWNMIIDRLDDLVPHRWRTRLRVIVGEVDGVLAEFLHGQLLVMVALAAYYAIGLTIAGLSRGLAIGILTGLLVFIPYVGFGLGLVLGVIAAVLEWHGWPGFIAVLAVYGIGQLLESYLLVPFLVGDRIGLHPLAVIFALLAFGQAFGFVGVLMALPVSAMLLVALRHVRAAYAASPVYREE